MARIEMRASGMGWRAHTSSSRPVRRRGSDLGVAVIRHGPPRRAPSCRDRFDPSRAIVVKIGHRGAATGSVWGVTVGVCVGVGVGVTVGVGVSVGIGVTVGVGVGVGCTQYSTDGGVKSGGPSRDAF